MSPLNEASACAPVISHVFTAEADPASKTLLECALDCVRRGWFVLPCHPRKKLPAGDVVPHGVLDASNDEGVVRQWWAANPDYNPAIALGPSNLVVFDFDSIRPFDSLPPTYTVKTGREQKDGIGGIQMYYSGCCKTHAHAGGGGEVRSRGAYVMAAGAIHPSGNPYTVIDDRELAASPEQNAATAIIAGPAIGTDEQETIAQYVETAFDAAEIDYQSRVANDQGGFKWFIACPWRGEHTEGKDFDTSSAVIIWASGKLIYECKHGHCQNIRQWKELREWMEDKVGARLVFGDEPNGLLDAPPLALVATETDATPQSTPQSIVEEVDEMSEAAIPPFDPSVMNGIYAKFVELVTRGTTLSPQFTYVIAKTIVGARMAGKVKFQNLDEEPRFYAALIGATGSGKGEAWRRTAKILQPDGALGTCEIKIVNSVDSGAGLKDLFFDPPVEQPVLVYIDEIESLGNKSKDTRNPGILDSMIELADSTSISRVLAKGKNGGSKTKNDARLVMVMCGQEGTAYTKALAGRAKQGLWDRFYPEYGVPQETGDLPPVDETDAIKLLIELNKLDYSGTVAMSAEAKAHIDDFWKSQPGDVRKKARFKKNLQLDAYMSAFGRGVRTVEPEDAAIAVKIFTRQLIIRRVCFSTEVPDRTGYYIGLLKNIIGHMERRIAAGEPPAQVAKSRRDFETETNSFRVNEGHIFERAWQVHSAVYLEKFTVKGANGHSYVKFLPVPWE